MGIEVRKIQTLPCRLILLRDTMVVGFRAGLESPKDAQQPHRSEEEEEALYALLTLSLIVTDKETA